MVSHESGTSSEVDVLRATTNRAVLAVAKARKINVNDRRWCVLVSWPSASSDFCVLSLASSRSAGEISSPFKYLTLIVQHDVHGGWKYQYISVHVLFHCGTYRQNSVVLSCRCNSLQCYRLHFIRFILIQSFKTHKEHRVYIIPTIWPYRCKHKQMHIQLFRNKNIFIKKDNYTY